MVGENGVAVARRTESRALSTLESQDDHWWQQKGWSSTLSVQGRVMDGVFGVHRLCFRQWDARFGRARSGRSGMNDFLPKPAL